MKAKDIFEYLLSKTIGPWSNTCDKLIVGNPEKEVYKLATCFKLTAEISVNSYLIPDALSLLPVR